MLERKEIQEVHLKPASSSTYVESRWMDVRLENDLSEIPDKMAFKIGEVAGLFEIKPYVLRYWETEFDSLKPKKAKNNQRIYRKKDVEMVAMIKQLLYRDKFSIQGARTALKELKKSKIEAEKNKVAADSLTLAKAKANELIGKIHNLRAILV